MIQHFKVTVILCLGIVFVIGTGTPLTLSKTDNQVVTSTCNASQFDDDICTLTCTFPNTDGNFILNSCLWKYYSVDETVAVTLYNEETSYDDDNDLVVSYILSTYHPGFYECQLNITDQNSTSAIYEYTGAMNISGANPGVNLNGTCTASTDCYALNSVCNGTCQCTEPFDITFTSDDDTPACLTHQNEYTHCNIDEECIAENEDFLCVNTVCTCEGSKIIVEEAGREMCIDSAYLTNSCAYNEQCALFDPNSFCNVGSCDCAPGYYINKVDELDVTTYVCTADTTQPAPTTETTIQPPPTTQATTQPPPTTYSTTATTPSTSTITAVTVTTISSSKTETATSSTGTTPVSLATTTVNPATTSINPVPVIPDSGSMSGGAITGVIFAVLIFCGLIGAIGYTAFNKFQNRS